MPSTSHFHPLKRLDHQQHRFHSSVNSIPEDFLRQSLKYTKYFNYSLNELLVDHSTDPNQNTTRQYVKIVSKTSSTEGRFANVQLTIRNEKGETKILRAKLDPVQINGFSKKIQHVATVVPSPLPVVQRPKQNLSTSIFHKINMKKKTPKYHRHHHSKGSFTPHSIDSDRFDIAERQSAIQHNRSAFFEVINQVEFPPRFSSANRTIDSFVQRATEMFHSAPQLVPLMDVIPRYSPPLQQRRPPLLPSLDEDRFERMFSPPPSLYKTFCQRQPSLSTRHYSEDSFDYERHECHQSPSDSTFYINRPPDPYLYGHFSENPPKHFHSNRIHRSDYFF